MSTLKEKFVEKAKTLRAEVKDILAKHGNMKIADVTLAQAYGGMRDIKCMVWEPSALDPVEGIRFRGMSIPELREALPKIKGGEEPLPEALFYLLLIGEVPTAAEAAEVTKEWRSRERLPDHVKKTLDALPVDCHPMTQFSIGINAMQTESIFAKKYRDGLAKTDLWDPMYEDTMNILASLPLLAAYIYRRSYKGGVHIPPGPKDLDWSANFAHMLGYTDPQFAELLRLYLVLHADHEGGNVARTRSTWSDPRCRMPTSRWRPG